MSTVSTRLSIAAAAVVGNRRARRFWARRPVNAFTTAGYEVIPNFLPRAECERLVALADAHLAGPSHVVSGGCYTWVRSEAAHGRNSQVRELLNVEEIDEPLARMADDGVFQDLFAQRLGEPVELIGLSIQRDGVDTTTKRDFHVDQLYPPSFKAFVYLTDVEQDGDGPYTVIPGSHRRFARKLANDFVNAATSGARRDMHRLAPAVPPVKVLAPAGTLILSTQDAMHKGWGAQSRRARHALIAYATTPEHFPGRGLREGIEHLHAAAH